MMRMTLSPQFRDALRVRLLKSRMWIILMTAQVGASFAGLTSTSVPGLPHEALLPGRFRLRGGASEIDPDYAKFMQDPEHIRTGQAVGSIEADDVCSKLPWPEGSEGKRESFQQFQKDYQTAKNDFSETSSKLSVGTQQQAVHKITLKALGAMEPGAKAYISHGRMLMREDVKHLQSTLEYQSEKLLEEAICDLQDRKEELGRKIQRLETDMQDLLNNVFRGRFQLFMDKSGR